MALPRSGGGQAERLAHDWLALLARKPARLVTVALANKLASESRLILYRTVALANKLASESRLILYR
jgi:hypothetical protein